MLPLGRYIKYIHLYRTSEICSGHIVRSLALSFRHLAAPHSKSGEYSPITHESCSLVTESDTTRLCSAYFPTHTRTRRRCSESAFRTVFFFCSHLGVPLLASCYICLLHVTRSHISRMYELRINPGNVGRLPRVYVWMCTFRITSTHRSREKEKVPERTKICLRYPHSPCSIRCDSGRRVNGGKGLAKFFLRSVGFSGQTELRLGRVCNLGLFSGWAVPVQNSTHQRAHKLPNRVRCMRVAHMYIQLLWGSVPVLRRGPHLLSSSFRFRS